MFDWLLTVLSTAYQLANRYASYNFTINASRSLLAGDKSIVRGFLWFAARPLLGQGSYLKYVNQAGVEGYWFSEGASSKSEKALASGGGPIMLYIHGGAFISGHARMWSKFNIDLLQHHKRKFRKDLSIFVVEYTLAPDRRFPHQLAECRQAYAYLTKTLSINPKRIFISGDSAGGNLAISTLLDMDSHAKDIAGAVLFSPWGAPGYSMIQEGIIPGDRKAPSGSEAEFVDVDYIHKNFTLQGTQAYAPTENIANCSTDDRFNPFLASPEKLKNFPPMYVVWGESEVLRDSIDLWVQKAKDAGCQVDTDRREKQVHDWVLNVATTTTHAIYVSGVGMVSDWIEKRMIHSSDIR